MRVSRNELARQVGHPHASRHDFYESCGYPRVLGVRDFYEAYERWDIAGRLIEAYPDATWSTAPEVSGVQGWDELCQRLQVWKNLHRLDTLANVGHFGIMLLGFDGGESLNEPVKPGVSHNLLFMQPHSEMTARVEQWEDDPASERYGKPKIYQIRAPSSNAGGIMWMRVHHSRVLHVAERPLENDCIGQPRLKGVYNRLYDLAKLLGGGAEIYWRAAAPFYNFRLESGAEPDLEQASEQGDQVEEMMAGVRRYMRTQGIDIQQLAPGTQGDPTGLIDKELDFIAGRTGIPQRILIGSERGELASSQDNTGWAQRNNERRSNYAKPQFVEQLIQKLHEARVIDADNYEITWSEDDVLGNEARIKNAQGVTEALKNFMSVPGADEIVTPDEVRSMLGFEGDAPGEPFEETIDEQSPDVAAQFDRLRGGEE